MPAEPEGLAHALVELSRQAERLAVLDSREAEHFRQTADRLGALGTAVTTVERTVGERGVPLDALEALSGQVVLLTARLDDIAPGDDGKAQVYRPAPAPRWWKLQGEERDQALAKLRAWVEQIYRPMYGHLATVGACWQQHPLCLITLDWLSELWSVLYLQNRRSASVLAGQAEFQIRLLPAAAEQLAVETARCEHAQPRNGQRAAVNR